MSARKDLADLLASSLGDGFKVVDEPPTAGARFPNHTLVHVQRAGLTPSTKVNGWAQALPVYIVVAAESYKASEDALEDALAAVVTVLEKASGVEIVQIDRDVFFDAGDSQGWHGYRILTTTHTTTP